MDLALQVLSTNLPTQQTDAQTQQQKDLGAGFAALLELLMIDKTSTDAQNLLGKEKEMKSEEKQALVIDALEGMLEEEQSNIDSETELLGMLLGVKPDIVMNDLVNTANTKTEELPSVNNLQPLSEYQSLDKLHFLDEHYSSNNLQEARLIEVSQKLQTDTGQIKKTPELTRVDERNNMVSLNIVNEELHQQVDATSRISARGAPGLTVITNTNNSKGRQEQIENRAGNITKIEDAMLRKKVQLPGNLQDNVSTRIRAKEEDLIQQKNVQLFEKGEKQKVVESNDEKTVWREKEDFLSEQVTKQIAAKEISVSSTKTVEIQVEKLSEELPNIIKAKLQQPETKEGSRDFIIQLEPKSLGKMSVKLTSLDGIVSVKILVEQVESKSLIDNSLQNLKQNFLDQGIKYGRIDVEVGSQFAGQDNQQQQQNLFFNEQTNRRNYMLEGDYYSDIETNQATGMMISSSKVDYLA